jgi:hypothetical protein
MTASASGTPDRPRRNVRGESRAQPRDPRQRLAQALALWSSTWFRYLSAPWCRRPTKDSLAPSESARGSPNGPKFWPRPRVGLGGSSTAPTSSGAVRQRSPRAPVVDHQVSDERKDIAIARLGSRAPSPPGNTSTAVNSSDSGAAERTYPITRRIPGDWNLHLHPRWRTHYCRPEGQPTAELINEIGAVNQTDKDVVSRFFAGA